MGSNLSAEVLELIDNRLEYQVASSDIDYNSTDPFGKFLRKKSQRNIVPRD